MSDPLDQALDEIEGGGTLVVDEPGGRTTVDVIEADRLGLRVREVRVGRPMRDIVKEAASLPGRLRAIPARVVPCEVDPQLGGAVLRTEPEHMRRGRFFEVNVWPEETGIRRYRVRDGERTREDFTLTRDQLRDLIDEVRED
jgi:hypothetical protein